MNDLIERLQEEADTHRIGFCEPETAALLREAADLGYQLRTTAKVSNTAMGAKLAASAREARNG